MVKMSLLPLATTYRVRTCESLLSCFHEWMLVMDTGFEEVVTAALDILCPGDNIQPSDSLYASSCVLFSEPSKGQYRCPI